MNKSNQEENIQAQVDAEVSKHHHEFLSNGLAKLFDTDVAKVADIATDFQKMIETPPEGDAAFESVKKDMHVKITTLADELKLSDSKRQEIDEALDGLAEESIDDIGKFCLAQATPHLEALFGKPEPGNTIVAFGAGGFDIDD